MNRGDVANAAGDLRIDDHAILKYGVMLVTAEQADAAVKHGWQIIAIDPHTALRKVERATFNKEIDT